MRFSLFIYLFFVCFSYSYGQTMIEKPDDSVDPSGGLSDCIELVDWELPSEFTDDLYTILQTGRPFGIQSGYTHILNKNQGCQGDGSIMVSFAKTGRCEAVNTHYSNQHYSANIYFDNRRVAHIPLDGIGNETLSVPISELGLEQVASTPRIVPLELRISTIYYGSGGSVVTSSYTQETIQVMVVSNNDLLVFHHETPEEYNTYSICNRVALSDLDDRLQNCSTSESIRVTYQMVDFSSNSATSTFSAGFTIKASLEGEYEQSGGMTLNGEVSGVVGESVEFSEQEIVSNSLQTNQVLTLPPRSSEGCSFIGVVLGGKREYIQEYMVNCNQLEAGEESNGQFLFTVVQPTVCTAPETIPEECLPIMLNFEVSINDDDRILAGSEVRSDDCTINILAFQEPVPDHFQTILWEGPDGFEAVGNNIEDAPVGIYTVTVYNECGEEGVYTVDACIGGASTSDWVFNEESNQFCRTVTCLGGEDCEGITTEECLTPEFGEWEYDAATRQACREVYCPEGEICDVEVQCVEVHFGEWDYTDNGIEIICFRDVLVFEQAIAQDEHPATITYEYNEATNRCYRYTRCVDPWIPVPVVVNTESEEPIFEDWDFDQFLEVCIRAVNCFDLSAEEVQHDPDIDFENPSNTIWEDDNNDPVYTWDYDEVWGCTGYVFCDAFEPTIHPFYNDWTLNQGQGTPVIESVGYNEQAGVIRCVLDVDCRYNGWEYDTEDAFPPLLSDPIEASNASFIGSVENGGYCQYEYRCGNQVPYTLNQNFVGEIVGQDSDGNDLCVAYCDGFKASTSQPAVLCSEINGFVVGDNELQGVENAGYFQLKWQEALAKSLHTSDVLPQLSPNPFQNEILLQNIPSQQGEITAVLLDLNGEIVLKQHFKGVRQAKLSTEHLASGMYLFLMLGENTEILYERRLVKVK